MLVIALVSVCGAVYLYKSFFKNTEKQILHKVKLGLYYHGCGNPLHLRDGEYLPKVHIKSIGDDKYLLTILCKPVSAEELNNVSSVISSMINGTNKRYAVTVVNTDVAYNHVQFTIEDVTVDRSFTFRSVDEMMPKSATTLTSLPLEACLSQAKRAQARRPALFRFSFKLYCAVGMITIQP